MNPYDYLETPTSTGNAGFSFGNFFPAKVASPSKAASSPSKQELTETPLDLPAKIYRSPQPNVSRTNLSALDSLKAQGITHIVLLQTDKETQARTGLILSQVYPQQGFKVIHLSIPDFQVPTLNDFSKTIDNIIDVASDPKNGILMHCAGGIGRTGTVAAGLVSRVLKLSGPDAIAWVRKAWRIHAVETPQQEKLVSDYYKSPKEKCRRHIERLEKQLSGCGNGKAGRSRANSIRVQIAVHEERFAHL